MATARLTIDKLQPGMVVAEDILDPQGRVLIPAAVRLTPMFIKRLEKWQVPDAVVDAPDAPAPSPAPVLDAGDAAPGVTALKSATRIMEAATGGESGQPQEAFMRRTAEEALFRFEKVLDRPLMRELMLAAVRRRILRGPGGIPGVEEAGAP